MKIKVKQTRMEHKIDKKVLKIEKEKEYPIRKQLKPYSIRVRVIENVGIMINFN